MSRSPVLLSLVLVLPAAGCEIIADFDRDKIQDPEPVLPEAGTPAPPTPVDVDAGGDGGFPGDEMDAMAPLPDDAGTDGSTEPMDGGGFDGDAAADGG